MTAPPLRVDTAYRRTFLAVHQRGLALAAKGQARLHGMFYDAAEELRTWIAGTTAATNPLTMDRVQILQRQVNGILTHLTSRVSRGVADNTTLTVDMVLGMHEDTLADAFRQVGGRMPAGLVARLDQLDVRLSMARASRADVAVRQAGEPLYRTMLNRHLEEAEDDLERLLDAGMLRGVSPKELTRDVADFLLNEHAARDIREVYGLKPGDLSGLTTLEYDARRIAVSETLNTLREANSQATAAAGIVAAAKWQVSGRHEGLKSSPDECDDLAEADDYGYGPGYYPPEEWPEAPHPFCGCMMGGPVIYRPVEEWGTPRGDLAAPPAGPPPEPEPPEEEPAAVRIRENETNMPALEDIAEGFPKLYPEDGYGLQTSKAKDAAEDLSASIFNAPERLPDMSFNGNLGAQGIRGQAFVDSDRTEFAEEVRQELLGLLRGERGPEQWNAVTTVLHEETHHLSPMLASDLEEYAMPWGRATEEGMVEWQARRLADITFGGTRPQGGHLIRAYERWVAPLEALEKGVPGSVGKVWAETSAATRAETLGLQVKKWVTDYALPKLKRYIPAETWAEIEAVIPELGPQDWTAWWGKQSVGMDSMQEFAERMDRRLGDLQGVRSQFPDVVTYAEKQTATDARLFLAALKDRTSSSAKYSALAGIP